MWWFGKFRIHCRSKLKSPINKAPFKNLGIWSRIHCQETRRGKNSLNSLCSKDCIRWIGIEYNCCSLIFINIVKLFIFRLLAIFWVVDSRTTAYNGTVCTSQRLMLSAVFLLNVQFSGKRWWRRANIVRRPGYNSTYNRRALQAKRWWRANIVEPSIHFHYFDHGQMHVWPCRICIIFYSL